MKYLLLILMTGLYLNAIGQSDPKAIEIVQKAIDLSGGKDKLMTVKSMSRKMEINMPFGTSESETYYKDGKFAMKSSMGGNVMMEQKYDGNRAFMGGMQGNQIIDDEAGIKRIADQGKIFPQLNLYTDDFVLKLDGTQKINGKESHKLVSTDKEGNVTTQFYEIATGLLSRIVTVGEWQGTKTESTIDFGDYKAIDGILFAHSMKMSNGQFNMDMKITEIKINPVLADGLFMIN